MSAVIAPAHFRRPERRTDGPMARGLGWFSLGLGIAQLLLPRSVAAIAGVPPRTGLLRLVGLREILAGLGIFDQRKPVGALWSRVNGDMMDLALLTASLASRRSAKRRVKNAIIAVLGITGLDIAVSREAGRRLATGYGAEKWRAASLISPPPA